ncbi:(2E,6E)-farnesyl diphosphate synthase [bacterium HR23]|nr:(2E,6E)-farnesyl diphosphate synthase [bacterium HR23]
MPVPPALLDASRVVERGLRQHLEGRGELLYRMLEYHLGWRDAQGEAISSHSLYPYGALCVLAGAAQGLAHPLAEGCGAAVELLAHFHQVHREVQDGAPGSQERPTLWWLWGPAQAINAGDGFHAVARLALMGLGGRGVEVSRVLDALRLLDQTALQMCEGRWHDLHLQERLEVTPSQCQRIAQQQTGALIACALTLPAVVLGLSSSVQDLCWQAGQRLGIGISFWHDLRRWRSQASSSVLLNKTKTLPLALALQKGGPREKRELGAVFVKRVLEPADLPVLVALLERLEVFQQAEALAQQALEEGMALWRQAVGEAGADTLRPAVFFLAHEAPLAP